MGQAELQAMFDRLKKAILPAGCTADLVVQPMCAIPGYAVQCTNRTNPNGPHKICFPTQKMARCRVEGLMMHELTHSAQACAGSNKPLGDLEEEAYRIQCEFNVKRNCTLPKLVKERVDKCIEEGKKGSTNAGNVRKFGELCNQLWAPAPAPNPPQNR